MTVTRPNQQLLPRAYSLAEALIAAGILMIGISAAASLSLSMTTQEEISWRVARGLNMLENAAIMYQLGVDWAEPARLIPPDPDVTLAVVSQGDQALAGGGVVEGATYRVTISPVMDAGSWSAGVWTGGSDASLPDRTLEARAYRSTIDRYYTSPFPP